MFRKTGLSGPGDVERYGRFSIVFVVVVVVSFSLEPSGVQRCIVIQCFLSAAKLLSVVSILSPSLFISLDMDEVLSRQTTTIVRSFILMF